MTEDKIPPRKDVPPEYTWNAPSVFSNVESWETERKAILSALPEVSNFQGHLHENPTQLAKALETRDEIFRRAYVVLMYANMTQAVDNNDQAAANMASKAKSLFGQVAATAAFFEPELIAIGLDQLKNWMEIEPRLAVYQHYLDNLFRNQAHVRSAEIEELLGMLVDPFSNTSTTASLLTDADFKFKPAVDEQGNEYEVTQGTFYKHLSNPDREVRRTTWENYMDKHLEFKNTLASNLVISIKQNVFNMRARRHASTLEASLFENNVPTAVFHNLIDTFKKKLPIWQRYFSLRRKALGFDTLHVYDLWAPLKKDRPKVNYQQAVDWICEGLAPLGEEYVNTIRHGCLQDRWVDIYPNQGKTAGAFSYGAPGTYPFIVMSYTDEVLSLSTLAHELGHSMHSFLTWKTQPTIYSDYSLFVAEVASNFHQAMVRAYLLENQKDPAFQIAMIEEAMANFLRYFLIMPTLARFELETHQRLERGEGLSADDMNELMADLFQEVYADQVHMDRPRIGITWATFGHLYSDYYVYQYATGISGAHALAGRILSGTPGAVEAYLSFLKAGGSRYPLDALKMAGVDLTTPEPVEQTFMVLESLIDRVEKLI